jgi:hypothetical protein
MDGGGYVASVGIPLVLAGPIVRRADPTRICIWLATSRPTQITGEIVRLGTDPARREAIGEGSADTVAVGERLFVHLVSIVPGGSAFPVDEILAYDLTLEQDGTGSRRLLHLGVGGGRRGTRGIRYRGLPLPTLVLRGTAPELRILHGSCRQLHAGGEDALLAADELLTRTALDPSRRPQALFLTGDQIYADDVPGPLARHLTELGRTLLGREEGIPGVPSLDEIPVYGRTRIAEELAKFSSPKASNHLLGLGEFVAMYVTAWNERTWPPRLPDPRDVLSTTGPGMGRRALALTRYVKESRALERARRALPRVRRLLANTPTYMIFDDHDVTDDWNVTRAWRDAVRNSPTGRRVVANALAAFWAFQGWGNDPESQDAAVRGALAGLADGTVSSGAFEEAMWSHHGWAFHAPTDPPAVFIDTRTQRGYDSAEGGPRLLNDQGRAEVARVAAEAGHARGRPLLMVSAVPVCGLELVERRQKYLVRELGPYAVDFEAWHSNLQGFVDLVRLLVDELALPWAVMFSGDVHYGFTVNVTVDSGERTLPITQLVSSPIRHSGALSRVALGAIGLLTREKHERVGWDGPPKMEKPSATRRRVLERPSNTDDWNPDAPVFVAPTLADAIGVVEDPQYREWRDYAPIEGTRVSIVGLNNVGLMSLCDGTVEHRLLARKNGRTRIFTARVDAVHDDSRR